MVGYHMVLQQGIRNKVWVWGKADPDEAISVTLGGRTPPMPADCPARRKTGSLGTRLRWRSRSAVRRVTTREGDS